MAIVRRKKLEDLTRADLVAYASVVSLKRTERFSQVELFRRTGVTPALLQKIRRLRPNLLEGLDLGDHIR